MKSTRVTVKKTDDIRVPEEISLPEIQTSTIPVRIAGLSNLLVNKFHEKSQTEIEEKQKGSVTKSSQKAPRDPEAEYQRARILDEKGRDCVPGRYIKAALVTAATWMPERGYSKLVKGSVYVVEDLVPIECKGGPHMRSDMCRVGKWGSKQPMMRYRAEYRTPWSLSFHIQFEPAVVSAQHIIYLIRRAGLNVGLCEWRPEKNGELGRFELKLAEVSS